MCRFGATKVTHEGAKFVKGPAGFLANSPLAVEEINRVCAQDHEHIALEGKSGTVQAQICPPELC